MKKTICVSENRLMDYFYGETPPAESERVRRHLGRCASCEGKYAEISTLLSSLCIDGSEGGDIAVGRTLEELESMAPATAGTHPVRAAFADEIFTVEEAASYLKVGEANVMNSLPLISHFVLDGRIRIRREALLEFIRRLETPPRALESNEISQKIIFLKKRIV